MNSARELMVADDSIMRIGEPSYLFQNELAIIVVDSMKHSSTPHGQDCQKVHGTCPRDPPLPVIRSVIAQEANRIILLLKKRDNLYLLVRYEPYNHSLVMQKKFMGKTIAIYHPLFDYTLPQLATYYNTIIRKHQIPLSLS